MVALRCCVRWSLPRVHRPATATRREKRDDDDDAANRPASVTQPYERELTEERTWLGGRRALIGTANSCPCGHSRLVSENAAYRGKPTRWCARQQCDERNTLNADRASHVCMYARTHALRDTLARGAQTCACTHTRINGGTRATRLACVGAVSCDYARTRHIHKHVSDYMPVCMCTCVCIYIY